MRNTLNQFQAHKIHTLDLSKIKGGNDPDQTTGTAIIITEDIMDG